MNVHDLEPYPDETAGDRAYLAASGWQLERGAWRDPETGDAYPDNAAGVARAASVERGRWFEWCAGRRR